MSYKWHTIVWAIIPLLASTYGSGSFNAGNYNGAVVGTPVPVPTAAPVIAIGPITLPGALPVTGAAFGAIMIAAAAALAVWVIQRRKARD